MAASRPGSAQPARRAVASNRAFCAIPSRRRSRRRRSPRPMLGPAPTWRRPADSTDSARPTRWRSVRVLPSRARMPWTDHTDARPTGCTGPRDRFHVRTAFAPATASATKVIAGQLAVARRSRPCAFVQPRTLRWHGGAIPLDDHGRRRPIPPSSAAGGRTDRRNRPRLLAFREFVQLVRLCPRCGARRRGLAPGGATGSLAGWSAVSRGGAGTRAAVRISCWVG